MTTNKDQTLHSLIGIQPRHLRLKQFRLNNYLRLPCKNGGSEDDLVTTVSELIYLDDLISGIMGDNDHGQK